MRVIRNTPDQLVLAHSPWLYALLLGGFAAIFSLSGLNALMAGDRQGLIFPLPVALCVLFFWVLVRPVRVIFDRPSQSVEIITTYLTRRERVTHRLSEISRAALSSMRTSKGFERRAIHLVIAKGESAGNHPITGYAGGPAHGDIAWIINKWLKAARP